MPIQTAPPNASDQKPPSVWDSPRWAILKVAYRVFNVITLISLVVMIFLVLHKSPPPTVATDPQAAARAAQKFVTADAAKASGMPAQVALDSTELNSYLSQSLALNGGPQVDLPPATPPAMGTPAPGEATPAANPTFSTPGGDAQSIEEVQQSVKDLKVDMDGDLVKAYVVFNLHGQDLSLELDGHLASENGYMKFEPVAGKLGSLPLPQSALDAAVERMMNSPENREKLRLPDDISDVQVQNGQAVVTYK
jgi:hypothetical protein